MRKTVDAETTRMKTKRSYDYYLVLAACALLFIISLLCIASMFYYKLARIQEMQQVIKTVYMNRMNTIVSPFIIGLILVLSVCVPKRLLPVAWLHRFVLLLAIAVTGAALGCGIRTALLLVLASSLVLQSIVVVLAIAGGRHLNFEKKGYWLRVGSSLIHLGLILFVLDLLLHQHQRLHLALFWITTAATVLGMLFSFYADGIIALLRKRYPPFRGGS